MALGRSADDPRGPVGSVGVGLAVEVAEDLADLEEEDTPPGEVEAEDGGQDDESGEMLMPRRSSNQIQRADDRGDRRPLAG
jgi:hypothetical protein